MYCPDEQLVKDSMLSDLRWNGRDLPALIELAVQQQLNAAARAVLYA
jgi:hypothetical protein